MEGELHPRHAHPAHCDPRPLYPPSIPPAVQQWHPPARGTQCPLTPARRPARSTLGMPLCHPTPMSGVWVPPARPARPVRRRQAVSRPGSRLDSTPGSRQDDVKPMPHPVGLKQPDCRTVSSRPGTCWPLSDLSARPPTSARPAPTCIRTSCTEVVSAYSNFLHRAQRGSEREGRSAVRSDRAGYP